MSEQVETLLTKAREKLREWNAGPPVLGQSLTVTVHEYRLLRDLITCVETLTHERDEARAQLLSRETREQALRLAHTAGKYWGDASALLNWQDARSLLKLETPE